MMKKVLLILLLLLVVVVDGAFLGLFVLSKGARGESRIEASVLVKADKFEVREWIVEPDKTKLWREWLVDSDMGGEVKEGSVYWDVWSVGERRWWVQRKLIKLGDNELRFESETSDFEINSWYVIEDTGVGIRVSLIEKVYFRPFFLRLFEPFIRTKMEEQLKKDLDWLRLMVESE